MIYAIKKQNGRPEFLLSNKDAELTDNWKEITKEEYQEICQFANNDMYGEMKDGKFVKETKQKAEKRLKDVVVDESFDNRVLESYNRLKEQGKIV